MADTPDSSDALPDFQDTLTALGEHMRAVVSEGSFSWGSIYDAFPLPGIIVDGLGNVDVPLQPQHAQKLAALGQDSTFARMSHGQSVEASPTGAEGLLDQDIRKTKEIDMGKVKFRNPFWDDFLLGVKRDMCAGLGVKIPADNVTLEPYKMLLYEEGAMFKPHKDAEKSDGMFATLVICLPSEHTGGELVTWHMAKGIMMETSPGSRFGVTSLAWYTDVRHEVKPVTSGYRWCLTYGVICNVANANPSAQQVFQEKSITTTLLRYWLKGSTTPNVLVYPLEHEYTLASLKIDMLKGNDAPRCEHLRTACKGLKNVTLQLCGMERRLCWNPMPSSDYECDSADEDHQPVGELLQLYALEAMLDLGFRHSGVVERENMIDPSIFDLPRRYEQYGGDHFSDRRPDDIERIYQFTVLLLVKTPTDGR